MKLITSWILFVVVFKELVETVVHIGVRLGPRENVDETMIDFVIVEIVFVVGFYNDRARWASEKHLHILGNKPHRQRHIEHFGWVQFWKGSYLSLRDYQDVLLMGVYVQATAARLGSCNRRTVSRRKSRLLGFKDFRIFEFLALIYILELCSTSLINPTSTNTSKSSRPTLSATSTGAANYWARWSCSSSKLNNTKTK